MTQKVLKKIPAINEESLRRVLYLLRENIEQHGDGVAGQVGLEERGNALVIHCLNPSEYPLPESLRGKTFSAQDQAIRVPKWERNPSGTRQGTATYLILTQLRGLYPGGVKLAKIRWYEKTEPTSNQRYVVAELTLPF